MCDEVKLPEFTVNRFDIQLRIDKVHAKLVHLMSLKRSFVHFTTTAKPLPHGVSHVFTYAIIEQLSPLHLLQDLCNQLILALFFLWITFTQILLLAAFVLALLTVIFCSWFFFLLEFEERIYKGKEIVVRGNSWHYHLEDDKNNAHEATGVRKGIWNGHYLSLGDFVLVVHHDIHWDEWRFCSIIVRQILHCIVVHPSFNKGSVIGWAAKKHRIIHLYLVLTQQNVIVVAGVELRSQLIKL